jgi:hypothetical protein
VTFGAEEPKAEIPFVVEAWAIGLKGEHKRTRLGVVCVNRTPVTGDISARRNKRDIDIVGCGLGARPDRHRGRAFVAR